MKVLKWEKKNPFSCILAFIDFKNGQTEKESSYNVQFSSYSTLSTLTSKAMFL